MHALELGRVDEQLEPGPRRGQVGNHRGLQLDHEVGRVLPADLEMIGPQGGLDHPPVGAQDPVLVETGHLVELAADLLGDRLAALGLAIEAFRIESGLKQPDQQPGDGDVGGQDPLDVILAEPAARLAQVSGIGAEHHRLPPGQVRVDHQSVEPVILDIAPPQRGQGVLEQGLDRVQRGRHPGLAVLADRAALAPAAQPEVIDPERLVGAELVRMLVDHLDAHVLEPGQHIGQRDRGTGSVDGQPPDPPAAAPRHPAHVLTRSPLSGGRLVGHRHPADEAL